MLSWQVINRRYKYSFVADITNFGLKIQKVLTKDGKPSFLKVVIFKWSIETLAGRSRSIIRQNFERLVD